MTEVALSMAGVVVTLLLALLAYRCGTGRRRALLPGDIVEELAEHKLHCLAEPPERVELELRLLLGVKRIPASCGDVGGRHRLPAARRGLPDACRP